MCDMTKDCQNTVTHIGSKGYIYCVEHAIIRMQSGYERTPDARLGTEAHCTRCALF
jgi:hypothetical protein